MNALDERVVLDVRPTHISLEELMMGDPAEQYQRERGLRMGGMG